MAVLIEHCGGNFPLWLSPDQFAILPISEKYHDFAEKVKETLEQHDIRGYIDNRDEKIGRKIRDAEVSKVPYMLIVGEKEQESDSVSVRRHGEGDLGTMTIGEFTGMFQSKINEILNN